MPSVSERRSLLGILVYNGRDVVSRCLDSATALIAPNVDVVVFDDCSPSPGWSEEVAEMCRARGIGYYRTPRNLGIPRNMSLVMRTAEFERYDVVGLVNSDVVIPVNLVEAVGSVFEQNAGIASVTPWSNNVSAFSLPMEAGGETIREQRFVSDLSDAMFDVHGSEVIDIPTGVGYCMMIDVEAVRRVGVMDPIFGRGYCEEVDWCQRALQAGLRHVLSLGTYVYHEGSGTNRHEGLLAHGQTTVIEHELIIRGRYPDYMPRVLAFLDASNLRARGTESLGRAFMRLIERFGYDIAVSDAKLGDGSQRPLVRIQRGVAGHNATVSFHGVEVPLAGCSDVSPDALEAMLGRPASITVAEPGDVGNRYRSWITKLQLPGGQPVSYPTRV